MNKQEQEAIDKVSPLCRNCKHIINYECGSSECRKAILEVNPVHGNIKYNYCHRERSPILSVDKACGPEGKYFEPCDPELTIYQKFLNLIGVVWEN